MHSTGLAQSPYDLLQQASWLQPFGIRNYEILKAPCKASIDDLLTEHVKGILQTKQVSFLTMLQRIHGNKCYNHLSRRHTSSLLAKQSNTRVVAPQSQSQGTSPIPKSSLSDIEKFCIETWCDWGAGQFRRVKTTSGRGVHVVGKVPSPDECSEILWRIVQAEQAFKNTNRCQLYNNALVNGAVEGLKVSLPRLPESLSNAAHGDLQDVVGIQDEHHALSLEYVPRTMLSMAFLGCHLAWEEQMDSLCQKIPLTSSWQSLRQACVLIMSQYSMHR